jgi:hypothetical protein
MNMKICVQEYSQPICAGLGVQAIISLLTAEVTMVCLGTSHNSMFCHCFCVEHFFLTYSIYALNRIYITRACDVTCSQLFSNGLK